MKKKLGKVLKSRLVTSKLVTRKLVTSLLVTSFLAASLCFSVLGITSCSGIEGLSETTQSNGNDNPGACTVSIGIANMDNNGQIARTILPGTWSVGGTDGITGFKITGTSNHAETLDPTELTFDEHNQSKVVLSYALWNLTLTAYKDEDEVLKGNTSVDLSNGITDEIKFVLKAAGLTTPGSLDVDGTYTDTDGLVKKIEYILTDFNSGNPIGDPVVVEDPTGTFEFDKEDLIPGTYNFAIKLYNEDDRVLRYYSDLVQIDAGNTSKSIDLSLTQLPTKPVAPENLKAYLVEGSETANDYKVKFTWEDISDNEEGFILSIDTYDGLNGTATPYKTFTYMPSPAATEVNFWESPDRADGTLMAGSTSCVVTLPLGKLFDASIKASNFIGNSPDCARVEAVDEAGLIGYDVAKAGNINRLKIEYNLNGGSLKKEAATQVSGKYVEYYSYTGDDITLFGLDGDELKTNSSMQPTVNYPTLIDTAKHPFQRWIDYSNPANEVTTASFENVFVKADYNLEYLVSYEVFNYTDLDAERVLATYGATFTDCKNGSIPITESITITVAPAVDAETVYDSYIITVDGTTEYSGSDNAATFEVGKYGAGIKTVTVTAKEAGTDGNMRSFSFALKIIN